MTDALGDVDQAVYPHGHPLHVHGGAPVSLESVLRVRRDSGHKLLVPYVTGGVADWCDALRAAGDEGADAVEIGIPFSDPVMDGPTIQEASELALRRGTTPFGIIEEAADVDAGVPQVVMTYANVVHRMGARRFAGNLAAAGIKGAIVPDLPLEELAPWTSAADDVGVETILLAAPVSPDERLVRIAERSRGWVYAVGLMGVTGERTALADSAILIAKRLKAVTDKPVLVGVGISTPEQAVAAAAVADGVIVGSAIMRTLLDGHGPSGVGELVRSFRRALDRG